MTDTAPPRVWRRPPLRNTLGDPVPVEDDEQGAPRASNAGRLVVVSGQTIASAWGNTTYDQTMQVFTTSADRANQWPSPVEGAQSWLTDSGTPWIYRAGAWRGIPLGFLASSVGPPTALNVSTAVNVLTLAVPIVAGRRYRVSAYILGSQATAAGTPIFSITGTDIAPRLTGVGVTAAVGVGVAGTAVGLHSPNVTTTATYAINGFTSAGTFNITANGAYMLAEDIGS